jgi:hypothetical protein
MMSLAIATVATLVGFRASRSAKRISWPCFISSRAQLCDEPARLDADHASRQLGEKCQHLRASKRLANDDLAGCVNDAVSGSGHEPTCQPIQSDGSWDSVLSGSTVMEFLRRRFLHVAACRRPANFVAHRKGTDTFNAPESTASARLTTRPVRLPRVSTQTLTPRWPTPS